VTDLAERLPQTRAVIDEAARLYPPIAAISRVAIEADTLAGEAIPRGTLVVIAPYVLHRHRMLWPDPDVFDPARFLDANPSRIDRFSYLPFGAGPRTCVGSTFALQEATLVLATIVKSFAMRLVPGHSVWPLLRVTLRPAGGLPMTLRWIGGQPAPANVGNGALAEHELSQEARHGLGG
jgi:cytochrome P450